MHNRLVTLIALVSATSVFAETTTKVDSISTRMLQEVVVQAPKIIHKTDMDVYIPSKVAVDNSKNGVQLVRNLMIPSLTVNEAMGTITAAGQTVQVRINGREATVDQLKALLPETIKRVEWIDDPGLRYNGAAYVLNYIVTNPSQGGSLMIGAEPMLNQRFGTAMGNLKLNSGRSQWSVGLWGKLCDNIDVYRDYNEKFTYPDGHSLIREETPLGGSVDNSGASGTLAYSYIKPDTTVLYVGLDLASRISDRQHYNGILSLSDGRDDIMLTDINGSNGTTPSLSAYLEQHLAHRQTIVIDFRSSFYTGKSYSNYIERDLSGQNVINDVNTSIRDRNQSYSMRADYIKTWRSSRFTAGVSYTANRNRSLYENLEGEIFHQRQNRTYIFAEYYQRINKLSVTLGLGAQYTDLKFLETGRGTGSWNMSPKATLNYSINSNHRLRLQFSSWQTAPSLSQTNIAPQQIDGFQWRIGNPDLKTSTSYKLTMRYNFSLPRVDGSFGVNGFTCSNPVAMFYQWDGDRLISSYENSRGRQYISVFLAPQIEVIPGWLTVSGSVTYDAQRTKGTGYRHYYHSWHGDVSVMLSYRNFILSGQYQCGNRNLNGETITRNETFTTVDLSYNYKNWRFGAGMLMPFGTYDQGSRSLNRYNTNESHMRLNLRMPYISINYNFQWGHQKRGARKLIETDATVERSTTGSR